MIGSFCGALGDPTEMFSVSEEWQMNVKQAADFNRHARYLDSQYRRTRGSGTSKEWYAHGGWRAMAWFVQQKIVQDDGTCLSLEGMTPSGQGGLH